MFMLRKITGYFYRLCLTRSIKRKKFDDELVESSLVKSSSRVKGPPLIEPVRCLGSELSSSEKKKVCTTTNAPLVIETNKII